MQLKITLTSRKVILVNISHNYQIDEKIVARTIRQIIDKILDKYSEKLVICDKITYPDIKNLDKKIKNLKKKIGKTKDYCKKVELNYKLETFKKIKKNIDEIINDIIKEVKNNEDCRKYCIIKTLDEIKDIEEIGE